VYAMTWNRLGRIAEPQPKSTNQQANSVSECLTINAPHHRRRRRHHHHHHYHTLIRSFSTKNSRICNASSAVLRRYKPRSQVDVMKVIHRIAIGIRVVVYNTIQIILCIVAVALVHTKTPPGRLIDVSINAAS
jgi:hypothetical protein